MSDIGSTWDRIETGSRRIARGLVRRLDSYGKAQPMSQANQPFQFNEVLHSLREAELYKLPRGRVFLSAGCSGGWYFDWIEKACRPSRHIGIELFSPRPDTLPANCEWIAASISAFPQIADDSIDIIFSGQNFEHLWPEDIIGFLLESRRVLRAGGILAVDTPNRAVTSPMRWVHPEHTAEFTIEELHQMFRLAGFDVVSTVGHWFCHDRDTGERFPLLPDESRPRELVVSERVSRGIAQPEDAFSVWINARVSGAPDEVALRRYVETTWLASSRERMTRATVSPQCQVVDDVVAVPAAAAGFVMWGPYLPLLAGDYEAVWRLRLDTQSQGPVATVDVVAHAGTSVKATRIIDAETLAADRWTRVAVPFTLDDTTFGVEFRLAAAGGHAFSMGTFVQVERV